jgi:hypothetical protein
MQGDRQDYPGRRIGWCELRSIDSVVIAWHVVDWPGVTRADRATMRQNVLHPTRSF